MSKFLQVYRHFAVNGVYACCGMKQILLFSRNKYVIGMNVEELKYTVPFRDDRWRENFKEDMAQTIISWGANALTCVVSSGETPGEFKTILKRDFGFQEGFKTVNLNSHNTLTFLVRFPTLSDEARRLGVFNTTDYMPPEPLKRISR